MATVSGLLTAFKNLFPQAGALIESYGAVARDGLLADSVNQGTIDGVSIEFKGYGTDSYPYTIVNSVYLPPSNLRVMSAPDAMTVFLFETRNAMRAKKYCELNKKAALNQLSANSFATFMAEYETRGGLEVGKMWQQIIDRYGQSHTPTSGWAKYYYNLYLSAPSWETNSTQLSSVINSVLASLYQSGQYQGKSRQWYYVNVNYADVTSAAKKASYASSTCSGNTLVYTASASTMPVGIA
jgi:hypothetical protein